MIKAILTSAILLFSLQLNSLEYGLFAKKEGSVPITKVALFSERCSGSNYILSLIQENFEILTPFFCHKHFPPWFELPAKKYCGNPQHYHFEGTEDYLFIIVFRDPYDWVRSFHRIPWHAHPSLQGIPFEQFIRRPWRLDPSDFIREKIYNPLMDQNPIDGSPFKNVLELRTAKIRTMLKIKNKANNVYYLNYESVRDHPREVLEEIQNRFGLVPNPAGYQPVLQNKGFKNQPVYTKRKYLKINKTDLDHINSNLDKPLERKIGYRIIKDPEKLE